jgi:TetR/AcrR family transcriptional repressor of mexCD-oprJ operon
VGAIAQATGVARGTIYRYFPTRQALLSAVLDQAVLEADRRLTQANLGAVPVAEGLARAVRALVALGDDYPVLVDQRLPTGGDIPPFAAVVALVGRGRQASYLRTDLPLECPVQALYALVHAFLHAREPAAAGPEDVSATALRLFLEGSQSAPTGSPRCARDAPQLLAALPGNDRGQVDRHGARRHAVQGRPSRVRHHHHRGAPARPG